MAQPKKKLSKKDALEALAKRASRKVTGSTCARLRDEAKRARETASRLAKRDAERKKRESEQLKKKAKTEKARLERERDKAIARVNMKMGCAPAAAKKRVAKTTATKNLEERLLDGLSKAIGGKSSKRKAGKKTAKKSTKRGAKKGATRKPTKAAIKRGTDMEAAEHPTMGRREARRIALDHLNKDPKFYDKANA